MLAFYMVIMVYVLTEADGLIDLRKLHQSSVGKGMPIMALGIQFVLNMLMTRLTCDFNMFVGCG